MRRPLRVASAAAAAGRRFFRRRGARRPRRRRRRRRRRGLLLLRARVARVVTRGALALRTHRVGGRCVRATPRAIDRWRSMWIEPSVIISFSRRSKPAPMCTVLAHARVWEPVRRDVRDGPKSQLVYVIAMKTNTFPFNNRRPRDLQAKPWGQSPSHRPRDASSHPLVV